MSYYAVYRSGTNLCLLQSTGSSISTSMLSSIDILAMSCNTQQECDMILTSI